MVSHYTYAARDNNGQRITGQIVALSAEEALDALQEAGVYVISIEPVGFGGRGIGNRVILPSHEKVLLLESWTRLIDSGLSMDHVMSNLEKSVHRPSVKRALRDAAELMRDGMCFSDAVGASGLFPLSWVSVMEAGEKRGDFIGPLKTLYKRSEQVKLTMQKLIAALMMPSILMTLIFVWFWIFVSMLAPAVASCIMEMTGIENIWWSGMAKLSQVGLYMLVIPLLAVFFIAWAVLRGHRSDSVMGTIPAFTPTRFPLVGPLVKKVHLMAICSELQLQLEAGIPVMTALITLIRSVPRPSLRLDLIRVYQEIFSGVPVWQALGNLPIMPQDSLSLLAAGHASGKLPEMLGVIVNEAGLDMETEAARLAIKMRTAAVILSGIIVGILVVAFTMVITCAFEAVSQGLVWNYNPLA